MTDLFYCPFQFYYFILHSFYSSYSYADFIEVLYKVFIEKLLLKSFIDVLESFIPFIFEWFDNTLYFVSLQRLNDVIIEEFTPALNCLATGCNLI